MSPEDNLTSELMADIALLKRPSDQFEKRPMPDDLKLLIEVSGTTLASDKNRKASLYTRAGIVVICNYSGDSIYHSPGMKNLRIIHRLRRLRGSDISDRVLD